ncbi:hypothetical protein [Streptomyces fungicidicus]|uniref:hypothetical protein n=1 Tax=Streptomyces fungicidicus TaxID=68203 RepID=UPI0036AAC2A5
MKHALRVAVLGAQEQVLPLSTQRLRQPAAPRRPGLLDGEASGDVSAERAQGALALLLLVAVRHAQQTARAEAHLVPFAPAAHPDGRGDAGTRRTAGGSVGGPEGGEQCLADQRVQVPRFDSADAQQIEVGEPAPERFGQEGQVLGLVLVDDPHPQPGGGTGSRGLQQDAGAPVAREDEALADARVRQPADLRLQTGVVEREPAEHPLRIGPVPAGAARVRRIGLDAGCGEGRLEVAPVVQQGRPFGAGCRVAGARIGRGQFVRAERAAVGVEEGRPFAGSAPLAQTGGVPGVPQVPGVPPVLGPASEDAGGLLVRDPPEAQDGPLRALQHGGCGEVQVRRAAGSPGRRDGVVAREDHGPVGGEGGPSAQRPRQVPAHQVRDEMAQVVLQRRGDVVAVLPGDLGQLEVDVHVRRRARSAPVARRAALGRTLDHPAGHRVAADPPPARRFVRWEAQEVGAGAHR